MSRATMNTGGIPIMETTDNPRPKQTPDHLPCHILILADFSGRRHRNQENAASLNQRSIIEVTRDNIDEVFQRMHVTLDIAIADKPIAFNEPDDLHPDFIYERVDLFNQFRALKRKLNNPATFSEAAQDIQSWSTAPVKKSAAEYSSISIPDTTDGMQQVLDDLLHSTRAQMEQAQSIQGLIQEIVAPYVIPAADPRLPELLASVDHAASHLMRKILHSSAFQNIESSWLGLQWLMKRIDTDTDLRVFIADVSLQEIADDNEAHLDETTALHQLLIEQRLTPGTVPFSLIVADYTLQDELSHCDALANLGSIAADLNAILVCGGSERIAGCEDLRQQPEPADWNLHQPDDDFRLLWNAIREQDYSPHIAMVAPRFLLRLPYGQRTRPAEAFAFEELPATLAHPYYLWGNGAWLIAAILGQSYRLQGWRTPDSQRQRIDNLPLHFVQHYDEKILTPCAEILMTDTTATALMDAGLLVVRSINHQDAVIVPQLNSIHPTQLALAGRWLIPS